MMKRLLPALLALALAGCWWEGPVFYPPDARAAQPFAAGRYRFTQPGADTRVVTLTRRTDGSWMTGDDPDHADGFFLLPLPGAVRHLWISETMVVDDQHRRRAIYGLVEPRAGGLDADMVLPCQDNEALVRAAGGTIVVGSDPRNPVCEFADRAALERALTAYAAGHLHLTTSFVPINR